MPSLEEKRTPFIDWKKTNDGVAVADIGFKKQLWALDPELDVVWDCGCHKWEIWKFPGQARVKKKRITENARHVMTIQTKDRSFRELGADILVSLQKGDTSKYSLEQLCAYFDKMDDNIQREKTKDFVEFMRAVSMETFDYVRNVLKVSVPKRIKPSDEKYLINVPTKKFGLKIFKPRQVDIIARAVGGN